MAQKERFTVKAKNVGRQNVSKNRIIEFFSRTHVAVPITLYFFIAISLLYFAITQEANNLTPVKIISLFFSGWLFFTLLEYVMHRWVFHMSIHTKIRKKIQYLAHGVHHEYPKDKRRLAMPVPVSLFIAALFFSLFWFVMKVNTFGFLPGVLVGYATYLLVHYIVHMYQPPNNFFKYLWLNHAIHHYKDNTVVFGVSSQLWDYIFGTMPNKTDA